MATAPQFSTKPNPGTPGSLTAANTSTAGTGATGRILVFTAEAVEGGGSILPGLRFKHLGTNIATLMRIFLNNGSDPEVAANNSLIDEKEIAGNTLSQTAESIPYDLPQNLVLKGDSTTPARIYVTLATGVAAGIQVTPMNGGDFN
jgi:hypothetical protein